MLFVNHFELQNLFFLPLVNETHQLNCHRKIYQTRHMAGASTSSSQATNDGLECSICADNLLDPRALPCGHSYCGPPRTCLSALQKPGDVLKCAICCKEYIIKISDMKPLYGIREHLESYSNEINAYKNKIQDLEQKMKGLKEEVKKTPKTIVIYEPESRDLNNCTPKTAERLESNSKKSVFNAISSVLRRALPSQPDISSSVTPVPTGSLLPENNHIKINDFCYIDDDYMATFCEHKNHFGVVVALIRKKNRGATACVKLIERCQCKISGDGTYDGERLLDPTSSERCLYLPVAKIHVINFHKHSSGKESNCDVPKVNDVCDVFLPSIKINFPAIVTKTLEPYSMVEVQMINQIMQYIPKYDQNIDRLQRCFIRNGSLYYQLRADFVRPLFSPSEIIKGTNCNLFVPNQGVFQCLVDSLYEGYRIQVTLLEGFIDMTMIKGVDDFFFQQLSERSFIVLRNFLQQRTPKTPGAAVDIDSVI